MKKYFRPGRKTRRLAGGANVLVLFLLFRLSCGRGALLFGVLLQQIADLGEQLYNGGVFLRCGCGRRRGSGGNFRRGRFLFLGFVREVALHRVTARFDRLM